MFQATACEGKKTQSPGDKRPSQARKRSSPRGHYVVTGCIDNLGPQARSSGRVGSPCNPAKLSKTEISSPTNEIGLAQIQHKEKPPDVDPPISSSSNSEQQGDEKTEASTSANEANRVESHVASEQSDDLMETVDRA